MPPIQSPPAIRALPTPPSTSDPAHFDTRADAFLGALPGWASDVNAAGQATHGNAQQAASSASAAQTAQQHATEQAALAAQHAASAGAASNARSWAAGRTWQVNDVVWGVSDAGALYRCTQAHSGSSTPPESDAAHWAPVGSRVPIDPSAGPASVTPAYDGHGRLRTVTSVIDGQQSVATLTRSGQRLSAVAVTWQGKTRTYTLHRNGQGRITSITSEITQ